MAESIEDLIARLSADDPNTQGLALEQLVNLGAEAVPALREALISADAGVRALAAEGLTQIADPATADAFAEALDDSDGRVRSQAAVGLSRVQDPRAIDALIRTLNDDPDILHGQFSRSAHTLIELGVAALPAVMPLLSASDEETRMRAVWIVNQIVVQIPGEDADWKAVSEALQTYDAAGTQEARTAAADRLVAAVERYVEQSGDDRS